VRNVRVLEVALLRSGKVITGARVYVLEDRRGIDPRRPVAVEPPHLDLHLLFGGVTGMECLDLERELVVRIAVVVAARAEHALEDLLHRRALGHGVVLVVLHGQLAHRDERASVHFWKRLVGLGCIEQIG